MTAGFFIDDPLGRIMAALLCYAGILLYATNAGIRGVRRAPQETAVTTVFAALLPISAAPMIIYTVQFVMLLLGMGALGFFQVQFALLRNRAVRAYDAGREPEPVSAPLWLLIVAPALLVAAYPIVGVIRDLVRSGRWNTTANAAELSQMAAEGLQYVFLAVLVYGGYMAAAWWLDQAWLRSVGRIRLLSADARFVWINLLEGVVCVVAVGLMMVLGSTSARGYAIIATLFLSLIPGINGLSWVYDAALRRFIILLVLFGVGAALVFGIHGIAAGLAMPTNIAWWIVLAAAVFIAVVLPARLDAVLERFFPRSSRMRARLVEIATEPLRAATRADAGAELLERLVHVLDSEGGIFVVDGAGSEPAVVRCVGRVDARALGATPSEAARYVDGLPLHGGPCGIEDLPLTHQPRLLEAGAVFVCPLPGRRTTAATLLLGPRRGWLYDVATTRTLRVFASQAGLALENLALVNARAHAEKLAALGEAAARIAHEIRNPLSAARSLVQLAGEADGVAQLTAPAVTELDRIGQLVTDLLAFARREETVGRAPVDLSAVCHSALNQVAGLARDADVEVNTNIAAATVAGDANRLVQVIANLCRNAIEALATSAAPRRLAVRCAVADGSACIEVSDTGPGIAAADLARIFEPFATTKSAGTGLGLAIARRIIEAHGGALAVDSVPGSETVFRVALPLLTKPA